MFYWHWTEKNLFFSETFQELNKDGTGQVEVNVIEVKENRFRNQTRAELKPDSDCVWRVNSSISSVAAVDHVWMKLLPAAELQSASDRKNSKATTNSRSTVVLHIHSTEA